MNSPTRKLSLLSAAMAVTLAAGSPALADDTEILVASPAQQLANRPNMLFIADTSGSMDGKVDSQVPYDPDEEYSGSCDRSRIYWSLDTTTPPSCTGTNNDWFESTALVCEQAEDSIGGGGFYIDIVAQYYSPSGAAVRWTELSSSEKTAMVECRRDRGEHGSDTSGSSDYAKRGGDDTPFTDDVDEEVRWGSAPTQFTYALYSGNYLNWRENPVEDELTKISVVRAVLGSLFSTLQDTNAGLARFNGNGQGGTVIEGIKNLDEGVHRDDLRDETADLPSSGVTPLSETLFEMSQYWLGEDRDYGYSSTTDSEILSSDVYVEPTSFECTNNFQILLSDGSPVNDDGAVARIHELPGFAAITGNAVCTDYDPATGLEDYDNTNGVCTDDVAAYLARPDETNEAVIAAKQTAGVPDVTTYTIGFDLTGNTAAIDLLRETAERGGGQYFAAENLFELQQVLNDIRQAEAEGETTFTSPSVAVNSFNRTRNQNDLFFTVFEAAQTVHWPGNLKRYRLTNGVVVDQLGNPAVGTDGFFAGTSRSFWSAENDGGQVTVGGAASKLPIVSTRRVLTNVLNGTVTTTLREVRGTTAGNFDDGDVGLTGATGEPARADLLDWIAGRDVRDSDGDGDTNDLRLMIGDPLHSQPASIIYGGTEATPEGLVFFGTNDGFLHAIDMQSGIEEWSFVPSQFLEDQYLLYTNNRVPYKNYGVDGDVTPVIIDNDLDGQIETGDGDSIHIIFGMRRGGNFIVALNVTNRNSPSVAWVRDAGDFSGLGQTWSQPTPARVKVGDGSSQNANSENVVLIFGGGYDPVHDVPAAPSADDGDGAGVYMVDLISGNLLWAAGSTANPDSPNDTVIDRTGAKMNRAIAGDMTVIDITGDGFADRMYAADLGGQLLRFDIFNGQTGASLVTGGVIAQLGANGLTSPSLANTRRFYNSPDITLIRDSDTGDRFLNIGIGSGYRAHPLETDNTDYYFAVRDPDVFTQLTQTQYDSYNIVTIDDLADVDRTSSAAVVLASGDRGWKLAMRNGEKVLSSSRTFQGTTFFSTFDPDFASTDPCDVSVGLNRLYTVDPATAAPFLPAHGVPDPTDSDVRSVDLEQAGIVSDPVIIFGDQPASSPDTPDRPPGCDPKLSDKECACLNDPTLEICSATSCADDPATAGAVVCVANFCTSLQACLRPVRTLWSQEGIE